MSDIRILKLIRENGALLEVPMSAAARYAVHLELMEEFLESSRQPQQKVANLLEELTD